MTTEKIVSDEAWMSRCFDLARRGIGRVSPNPPVGAVLVYQNRILSEGYHAYFGGPHAEVEAINKVPQDQRHLIPLSTLYVSLEPCCVTGKTPPCTDLILREGIKEVRISATDPNPDVAGQGMKILRSNGIHVSQGILEEEGKKLITSFTTNILKHRPYVILKWAQSVFGYTGIKNEQVWLSQPITKSWTHRQRAEADAIMVGARTVQTDNPSLTVRDHHGKSPHRVIYDPNEKLTSNFKVFNEDGCRVFYFSTSANPYVHGPNIQSFLINANDEPVRQILSTLFNHKIGILLVEGGAYLQNLFIRQSLWDEAWVIQTQHPLDHGIIAPNVKGRLLLKDKSGSDTIVGIERENQMQP